MDKIYDTLVDADRAKIDAIVRSVTEHLSTDGTVDVDLLMATLEQLNETKRSAREEVKKAEKAAATELKAKAAELGKLYVNSLADGDFVTFVYGTGPNKKTATLPIDKKGANTVQVTYTADMLGPLSKTAKRYIHYDKIVVPAEFAQSLAA